MRHPPVQDITGRRKRRPFVECAERFTGVLTSARARTAQAPFVWLLSGRGCGWWPTMTLRASGDVRATCCNLYKRTRLFVVAQHLRKQSKGIPVDPGNVIDAASSSAGHPIDNLGSLKGIDSICEG